MFARGSIYLFKVAGTDVRVHWTFFLLLAWLGAVYWQQGGMERAIWGVTFISILFFCVLLHEFGHIFAARRYGIKSPDVTLLPIGGVAALERMPHDPGQEIVVALAGPAVNLVIAGAIYAALRGNITLAIAAPGEIPGSFWSQIAIANLVL
ncbi:MAG: site-2 protease family protein, partial [Pseudomonadota bacterium]